MAAYGCFKEGEFHNPYYDAARSKPSPLSDEFDRAYFDRLITSFEVQKLSVKAFLATEQRIPGLGNGVFQDILYEARVHPKREIDTLTDGERKARLIILWTLYGGNLLRIGFDYTVAVTETAGIARYTRELMTALLEMDPANEYVLTVTRDAREDPTTTLPRKVKIRKLPFSHQGEWAVWHRFRLPLPVEFFTGKVEVFHSPDALLPPLRRAQGIVTIHDLSHMIYPQFMDPGIAKFFDKAVRRSLERARVVIAISNATKQDLVRLLGVREDKIEVIYNGVNTRFHPVCNEGQLSSVRNRYKIDHPFILSIGSIQPRKNLQQLIAAYSVLRQDTNLTHQLLFVGGGGWLSDDLFRQIERLEVAGDIRFLGYVPDEDLPALISLADVFAFPSLYEGFGLPPLEAMACGTPVVSSNASVMPEVLGDAALLVDPLDVKALAEALRQILLDDQLRTQLAKQGLKRSQRFTWTNAAQRHLEVYERVCKG